MPERKPNDDSAEPESQTIGSLARKIESSVSEKDSTPITPRRSSGSTGLAVVRSEPIGALRSELDAAKSLIVSLVSRGDPAVTEMSLRASLARVSKYCEIAPETDNPFTTFKMVGIRLESGHTAARELLTAAMRPAPQKMLAQELSRLRVLTVARNMGQEDLKALVSIYLEELAAYPADATIATLRAWPRENKFWPTLAELIAKIRECCEWRVMLARALGTEL